MGGGVEVPGRCVVLVPENAVAVGVRQQVGPRPGCQASGQRGIDDEFDPGGVRPDVPGLRHTANVYGADSPADTWKSHGASYFTGVTQF